MTGRNGITRFAICLLFVTAVFYGAAHSRDTYGKIKAERFPAFKYGEIKSVSRDDWQAQLIKFIEAGRGYPSAVLRVYVYAGSGTEPDSIYGIANEFAEFLREKGGDKIDSFVSPNGYRKEFVAELWVTSRHDDKPVETTPDEFFESEKFGEAGEISDQEFVDLLNSFMKKVSSDRSFQGYIINYGKVEEIKRRENLIRENISFRHGDPPRITIVNGGNRATPLTVFWLVPPGGKNPVP